MFGARIGARNERKVPFFNRDSEGAFGRESATSGGSLWTRTRWGKAVAAPGVRGQDAREKWKKTVGARCSGPGLAQEMKEESFFYRDSEGAFGRESATRGGSAAC